MKKQQINFCWRHCFGCCLNELNLNSQFRHSCLFFVLLSFCPIVCLLCFWTVMSGLFDFWFWFVFWICFGFCYWCLFVLCSKTPTKIQTKTQKQTNHISLSKYIAKTNGNNKTKTKTKSQATMSECNVWNKLVAEVCFLKQQPHM